MSVEAEVDARRQAQGRQHHSQLEGGRQPQKRPQADDGQERQGKVELEEGIAGQVARRPAPQSALGQDVVFEVDQGGEVAGGVPAGGGGRG